MVVRYSSAQRITLLFQQDAVSRTPSLFTVVSWVASFRLHKRDGAPELQKEEEANVHQCIYEPREGPVMQIRHSPHSWLRRESDSVSTLGD